MQACVIGCMRDHLRLDSLRTAACASGVNALAQQAQRLDDLELRPKTAR